MGPRPKKLDRFWTGFGLVLTGFGQVQKKHGFGQVLDRFWTGFRQVLIKSPKPVQKIGQVLTGYRLSGGLNGNAGVLVMMIGYMLMCLRYC